MSDYHLEILKKTDDQMEEYATMLLRLVIEIDKRPVDIEINKIKGFYHIDHYFIVHKKERIGIVKIFQGTFYYLGLEEEVEEVEIPSIIRKIEEYLGGWRINQLDAQVEDRYTSALVHVGYKIEFSRQKMLLNLAGVRNLTKEEEHFQVLDPKDPTALIDMVTDAYRYSIDENVGVFKTGMAATEIPAILKGKFGEFKPNLTPLLFADDSDYMTGACLVSISEDQPFIVLIGVRRSEQGQGIGRRLLSGVIRKSIAEGYSEIRLWVTKGNEAAEKLYISLGFKPVTSIHYMSRSL